MIMENKRKHKIINIKMIMKLNRKKKDSLSKNKKIPTMIRVKAILTLMKNKRKVFLMQKTKLVELALK